MSAADDAIKVKLAEWAEVFESGDAAATAALHTDDAQAFPPNAPAVRGRQDLENLWRELIDAGVKVKNLDPIEVDARDDLGFLLAKFSLEVPEEGGGVRTETGKVVDVLKRQADGNWKFHTTAWNMDTPLPGQ